MSTSYMTTVWGLGGLGGLGVGSLGFRGLGYVGTLYKRLIGKAQARSSRMATVWCQHQVSPIASVV